MNLDVPAAFTRELQSFRLPEKPEPGPPVTEADVEALPAVVARYLRFMGVVGQPRHASFRLAVEGRFRRSATEAWMPAEAWQYNTRTPIARIFRMRIRMAGFLPVVGHDTYADGHGRLLIKALDLFPLGDATGEPLDVGELVTWLNDAVFVAPTMLLGDGIAFSPAGDRAFDVSVTDGGRTVTARVFLDERGAPVDFETSDRFLQAPDGTWRRGVWHTPAAGWTTGPGGLPCPTSGHAAWKLPEGELNYVELRFLVETLRFDVSPASTG
jgi:hypothetical protein